jgi:hypothetical protein
MIINNLNLIRAVICPNKTEAILVIDPDAVLAFPLSGQFFQMITRGDAEFIDRFYRIKLIQFPGGYSPKVFGANFSGLTRVDPIEDIFSAFGFEVPDHE